MDIPLTHFTASAQASLSAALQDATTRRASELEPEHLLLAMLMPASAAWGLLSGTLGDPRTLREPTEAALADLPTSPQSAAPALSFRTERVLREATDEARRAGHTEVDAPHLLLGLMNEGGASATILRQRGIDAQALRHWVRQQYASGGTPTASPPSLTKVSPRRASEASLSRGPLWRVLPRLIDWRAVFVLATIMLAGGWMTTQENLQIPGVVFIVIGGWLVSLCAHEFAHALVADIGGDQSVREHGYLSFNPLAYTNILFSIILPVIFLLMGGIGLPGGAVYINEGRLRSPLWSSLVSAAGPLASFLVALFWSTPFWLGLINSELSPAPALWGGLAFLVALNLSAVLFNLLPVPPLDGFGMLAPFLPVNIRYQIANMGMLWLWLLFISFRYSQPLNNAFWGTVFRWLTQLHVSLPLVGLGQELFMFWQQ